MKLLNVLAVFAFIAVANGAVTTCNFCSEETYAKCGDEELVCSNDTFPNLGTTDCYSASFYIEDVPAKSRVARGCGNCSDRAAVQASFKTKLKEELNATLLEATFNIACCNNTNNCNNQTVSPRSTPTTSATTSATVSVSPATPKVDSTTPKSYATRLFPISGIVAFVAIILAVTL